MGKIGGEVGENRKKCRRRVRRRRMGKDWRKGMKLRGLRRENQDLRLCIKKGYLGQTNANLFFLHN